MSRLVLTKGQDGRLCGLNDKDQRAYARFKKAVLALQPGETLGFTYRLPRCPKHHAFFFLKLSRLLERTEAFEALEQLRPWLILGAGFVDFVPGLDGKPNAIPKSMDFDCMDETEFAELHRAIDEFLYTPRAQAVLWPQLNDKQRWDCIQSFLEDLRR